jgi:cytoskeleton protein RodZ
MRSGETFPVPPGESVTLTTGNAGGLDVLVDGRTLPPLGPTGGVRRDVVLDAAALLSAAPAP